MFAMKSSQKLNKLCKLALIRDGSKAQAYLQAYRQSHHQAPGIFPGTEVDLFRSLGAVPAQDPCSACCKPLREGSQSEHSKPG